MKQTQKYKMRFGESIVGNIDFIAKREEFLKSKKVLSRFKKLEKDEGLGWFDIENARELLNTFFWENTLEGYSYWHKINTEWLEYIGIFGKYHNLKQYETALEKLELFKSLLKEIDENGFEKFKYAFEVDNEQLGVFTEDILIRTFLGGYSNSEIIKLWISDFHLEQDYWKNVLEKIQNIDSLIFELDNNPNSKASLLSNISIDKLFS